MISLTDSKIRCKCTEHFNLFYPSIYFKNPMLLFLPILAYVVVVTKNWKKIIKNINVLNNKSESAQLT